jgi:hypothetical protein
MAKVYGIHEIELHAGVSEENFKKFFSEFAKLYENEFGQKSGLRSPPPIQAPTRNIRITSNLRKFPSVKPQYASMNKR